MKTLQALAALTPFGVLIVKMDEESICCYNVLITVLNLCFTACGEDFYKTEPGMEACKRCPVNSYTKNMSSVECMCYNHFYRAEKDSKSMPCTRKY